MSIVEGDSKLIRDRCNGSNTLYQVGIDALVLEAQMTTLSFGQISFGQIYINEN